jgi:hypothetical protein
MTLALNWGHVCCRDPCSAHSRVPPTHSWLVDLWDWFFWKPFTSCFAVWRTHDGEIWGGEQNMKSTLLSVCTCVCLSVCLLYRSDPELLGWVSSLSLGALQELTKCTLDRKHYWTLLPWILFLLSLWSQHLPSHLPNATQAKILCVQTGSCYLD